MRRVLFLTASYPTPELPGAGIFVREHARAVAPHAEVAVVHLDRAPVRRIHTEKVAGEEFPTWRVRYPRSPAPLSYASNLAAAALAVRRSGFKPDLIHAHFFLAGVPAVVLGRLLRTPVVLTEQWSVFLPDDPATLSRVVRRAARFAFHGADLVLPVSEALRDGIAEVAPRARFRIVPNVYDEALFHPGGAPAGERLLAVGGMYEAKGWEYLLEAVALLKERRPGLHLDVVGDGELRATYEALAHTLGLDGTVTFHGHRPKEEVAELMRAAGLFVLTSRYDSNPCVVVEALGSGLPVVATRVGGIPGMVGEGDGLLAEPRDPASIAARIEEALAEPARFDRAQIAASARERYSLAAVGEAFAAAYDEAERLRRGGTLTP